MSRQPQSISEFYKELTEAAASLVSGEVDVIANMANLSSLVFHALNKYVCFFFLFLAILFFLILLFYFLLVLSLFLTNVLKEEC